MRAETKESQLAACMFRYSDLSCLCTSAKDYISTVSVGVTYRFECVDKFVNMMVNTNNKDY